MPVRPWRVLGSAAAGAAGAVPGAVYYAVDLVGPAGGLFLAGAGGFVGLALTLPGVSARRVIRAAAGLTPLLWPVAALVGPPDDEPAGPPRAPPPPPAPLAPGLDPRWRTADAVALARGIAEDRAFDRLPLLADALMDAGCDDEAVLAHCRAAAGVGDRSWVVDLLLEQR